MSIPIFSHSRIGNWEKCPKSYELNYVGERPEIRPPDTIEAFMGKRVHETLEELYKRVKKGVGMTPGEYLEYYEELFNQKYKSNIIIVNGTKAEYFNVGVDCLSDYYTQHHPFNTTVLSTEQRITFNLDEAGVYRIRGVVDRIDQISPGVIGVHDYKTGKKPLSQKEADNDRQLALYDIAVRKLYPDTKEVHLFWHYLRSGKTITSQRSLAQTEQLRRDVIKQIDEIESGVALKQFPTKVTRLCDWCNVKPACPAFKQL